MNKEEFWAELGRLMENDSFIYWFFDGYPEWGEYKSGVPSASITCFPHLAERDEGKYMLTLRGPNGFTDKPMDFIREQSGLGVRVGVCKHFIPLAN